MIKDIIVFVLFVAIIISLVLVGVYFLDKKIVCPRLGKTLEMPVKFDIWAGGCFIQMENGSWIHSQKYQGVNIGK